MANDNLPLPAKKSLGQHFLNNRRVPELMALACDVKAGDTVLEIGPGTGMLTRELLRRGAYVIGIEADERAISILERDFKAEIANKSLAILHSDVRSLLLASLAPHILPSKYKVVANIPYYLSGMLFRTFLETDVQPTDLVFLVQKEVAERIARDKKESLLSLSVKVYGEPRYVKTIKRGNFTPPPKVDSAIIAVRTISKTQLGELRESDFFKLIHAGFASKRKQLLGNLTALFPRDILMHTFSTLGIRTDVRGEDLPLTTWLSLLRALHVHNQSL
jgi:16S rRNA (adenine1518-N6/adenine1519-N6)-dimethyltransferase